MIDDDFCKYNRRFWFYIICSITFNIISLIFSYQENEFREESDETFKPGLELIRIVIICASIVLFTCFKLVFYQLCFIQPICFNIYERSYWDDLTSREFIVFLSIYVSTLLMDIIGMLNMFITDYILDEIIFLVYFNIMMSLLFLGMYLHDSHKRLRIMDVNYGSF